MRVYWHWRTTHIFVCNQLFFYPPPLSHPAFVYICIPLLLLIISINGPYLTLHRPGAMLCFTYYSIILKRNRLDCYLHFFLSLSSDSPVARKFPNKMEVRRGERERKKKYTRQSTNMEMNIRRPIPFLYASCKKKTNFGEIFSSPPRSARLHFISNYIMYC